MTQQKNDYDDFYKLGYDFNDLEDISSAVNRYLSLMRKYQVGYFPNKYIEVGCGSGMHLQVWIGLFNNFYGLDISQSAINYAKKRLTSAQQETTLFLADILNENNLTSLHNQFDCIVSHRHFPNLFNISQLGTLFSNLKQILKPGALYIFDYVNYFSGIENTIGTLTDHKTYIISSTTEEIEIKVSYSLASDYNFSENYYLLSKNKLNDLLEKIGLKILAIEPFETNQKSVPFNSLRSIWVVQYDT